MPWKVLIRSTEFARCDCERFLRTNLFTPCIGSPHVQPKYIHIAMTCVFVCMLWAWCCPELRTIMWWPGKLISNYEKWGVRINELQCFMRVKGVWMQAYRLFGFGRLSIECSFTELNPIEAFRTTNRHHKFDVRGKYFELTTAHSRWQMKPQPPNAIDTTLYRI